MVAGDKDSIGSPQMATVSSDGTVRLSNIPMCSLLYRERRYPVATRLFRVHRIVNRDCNDDDGSSSSSSSNKSSTVFFTSSRLSSTGIQDPEYRICLPGVAMHSVDSCSLPLLHREKVPDEVEQCHRRLFVYGGSAGLVRIHVVDLPWM